MFSILDDLLYNPDEIQEALFHNSRACRTAYRTYHDLEDEMRNHLSPAEQELGERLFRAHRTLLQAVMQDSLLSGLRTGARLACDLFFDPEDSD